MITLINSDTIRKSGHCVSGVREMCALHNIDMRRLVNEGIPVEEVAHIEEAYIQDMIKIAIESELADGGK